MAFVRNSTFWLLLMLCFWRNSGVWGFLARTKRMNGVRGKEWKKKKWSQYIWNPFSLHYYNSLGIAETVGVKWWKSLKESPSRLFTKYLTYCKPKKSKLLSPCENITDYQMVNYSSLLHLSYDGISTEREKCPKEIHVSVFLFCIVEAHECRSSNYTVHLVWL